MKLRPRYSLLAFMLFTAAIAGGVKLWRGPHHVVDHSNPQMEDEYTYYRDWDGTKVMEGVRVRRYTASNLSVQNHQLDDKMKQVLSHPASGMFMLDFYRKGKLVHSGGKFVSYPVVFGPYEHIKEAPMFVTMNDEALKADERLEYENAILCEKQKYQLLGGVVWEFTGSSYK